jgi:hypothetical protein
MPNNSVIRVREIASTLAVLRPARQLSWRSRHTVRPLPPREDGVCFESEAHPVPAHQFVDEVPIEPLALPETACDPSPRDSFALPATPNEVVGFAPCAAVPELGVPGAAAAGSCGLEF